MYDKRKDIVDCLLLTYGYDMVLSNVNDHNGNLCFQEIIKSCPSEIGLREYCGDKSDTCCDCWKKSIDEYIKNAKSKHNKFLRI